jgi:peptidoglycan/xylan/chitin deacetylase (PgdA/CDA1 family)
MSWKNKIITPLLSGLSQGKLKWAGRKDVLTILAYHRILPDDDDFLFDRGVISASPDVFREQMEFVSGNFQVTNFFRLERNLRQKIPFNRPPLIITFDDGYLDNYQHAYPILRSMGLTATIFLTAEYIGTDRLFWWDSVAYQINRTVRPAIDLKISGEAAVRRISLKNKEGAIHDILRIMKNVDNAARLDLIRQITQQTGVNPEGADHPRQILNWDEARIMADNNIEFGSHTMSHPILANVTEPKTLDYEIRESKSVIESHTGKGVTVISYPVGRRESINGAVLDAVRKANYTFGVTYQHGINPINFIENDKYLKRFDIDRYTIDRFKAKLAFPGLFKR